MCGGHKLQSEGRQLHANMQMCSECYCASISCQIWYDVRQHPDVPQRHQQVIAVYDPLFLEGICSGRWSAAHSDVICDVTEDRYWCSVCNMRKAQRLFIIRLHILRMNSSREWCCYMLHATCTPHFCLCERAINNEQNQDRTLSSQISSTVICSSTHTDFNVLLPADSLGQLTTSCHQTCICFTSCLSLPVMFQ